MASHNEEAEYGYPVAPECVLWAPGASYAIAAPPGESGETDPPATTAEYDMGHYTNADMLPSMDNSEHRHHHPMATVPHPARLAEGGWSDLNDDFCHSQDGESDRSRISFLDALSSDDDGGAELSLGFRDPEGKLVLLEHDLTMDEDSMLEAGETADATASKAGARSTSPASTKPQSSSKRTKRTQSQTKRRNHRPSTKKERQPSAASNLGVNKATGRKPLTSREMALRSVIEASSGSFGKGKQKGKRASEVKREKIDHTSQDWRSFHPDSLPDKIRLLVNNLEMTEVGKDTKSPAIRNRQTGIAVTVGGIQRKWIDNLFLKPDTYNEDYLSECTNHLYEKAFMTAIDWGKGNALRRLRFVATAILGCCEYNEGNLSVEELSLLSEELIRRNIDPTTHHSPELGLQLIKQPPKPAPQDDTSTSLDNNSYLSTQHPGI